MLLDLVASFTKARKGPITSLGFDLKALSPMGPDISLRDAFESSPKTDCLRKIMAGAMFEKNISYEIKLDASGKRVLLNMRADLETISRRIGRSVSPQHIHRSEWGAIGKATLKKDIQDVWQSVGMSDNGMPRWNPTPYVYYKNKQGHTKKVAANKGPVSGGIMNLIFDNHLALGG